jgi:hypothetical protein
MSTQAMLLDVLYLCRIVGAEAHTMLISGIEHMVNTRAVRRRLQHMLLRVLTVPQRVHFSVARGQDLANPLDVPATRLTGYST